MQASQSLPPSPQSLSACCSLPMVIGPDQYTIAIICSMPKEFDPVRALFDDGVSSAYHNHGSREDNNIYIVGRFANHHTVLMMPGDVGELDAGMCAQRLRSHFSNIELTLLVGSCGAMPQKEADEPIYLGDVIVGTSVWRYLHAARSSQLEYRGVNLELRNLVAEGTSERTRQLGNLLKTEAFREEIVNNGLSHLEFLQRRQGGDKYKYPGHENDKLFKSNCLHRHRPSDHQCSCADPARSICEDAKDTLCKDLGCEKDGVERVRAKTKQLPPSIHVGTIASADIVMRARSEFDTGFKDRGVIGVDMEGGGVSHATDCIVIKGAVDYADTHGNGVFAHYAAAAAASIAKAILMILYRGNATSTSSLSVAGSAIPGQGPGVGSLIKGLADGDRVEDLKRRLDEIPEELEELFNKMLHGLKGKYFTDAARIFGIHRASKEMQLGFSQGLPLLALAFAEESTFNSAVEWPFKPLTGKEWLMRSITMKRRLSSRCNGLLEIEDPRRTSGEIWDAKDLDRLITDAGTGDPSVLPTLHAYGRALARTTVQYLHRTVKDYLEAPETWRSIERAAAENQPCPRTSLCLAHIILWKTFDRGASIADSQQTFKTLLEQCFESAFALSINDRNAHVQILDAIGASIFHEDSVAMVWNRLKITHPLENFLCFSVHCNFSDYVQAKLAILKPRDLARQCSRLLQVVVSKGEPLINVKGVSDKEEEDCESEGSDEEVWVGYRGPGGGPPVSMVEMLLRHHANPDHVIDGVSSRQIVMKRISDLRGMNPEDNGYLTFTLNRILKIFEGRSKQKNISRSRGRKAKRLSK